MANQALDGPLGVDRPDDRETLRYALQMAEQALLAEPNGTPRYDRLRARLLRVADRLAAVERQSQGGERPSDRAPHHPV